MASNAEGVRNDKNSWRFSRISAQRGVPATGELDAGAGALQVSPACREEVTKPQRGQPRGRVTPTAHGQPLRGLTQRPFPMAWSWSAAGRRRGVPAEDAGGLGGGASGGRGVGF